MHSFKNLVLFSVPPPTTSLNSPPRMSVASFSVVKVFSFFALTGIVEVCVVGATEISVVEVYIFIGAKFVTVVAEG